MIIQFIVEETFLLLFLQAFSTEEALTGHVKDYFKINCKWTIKMPNKCE